MVQRPSRTDIIKFTCENECPNGCNDDKTGCKLENACSSYSCPDGQKAVPVYLNGYDEPQGCHCCEVYADQSGPSTSTGYEVIAYINNRCCGTYTYETMDYQLDGKIDVTETRSFSVGKNGGGWLCGVSYTQVLSDTTITEGYSEDYTKFCSVNSTYPQTNYCYCSSTGDPMMATDNPC